MSIYNDVYLIDSNILIEPSKKFYSFVIAPSFWTFLKDEILNGNVILMDLVAHEVSKGTDTSLGSWMSELNIAPLDRRSPDILTSYGKVMTHIQTSGLYTSRALTTWSGGDHADPWIVATAAARNYTVVTFEQPNHSLGTSLSSRPRIPDVCKEFGLTCISLYQFMNTYNFSFSV